MPKNVTLNEVAKKAGVSAATASLAINGRPGVSPETVKSVHRVVSQLGYARPSQSGQMSTGKGQAKHNNKVLRIGFLVIGHHTDNCVAWHVYAPLFNSLTRHLQEHDHNLVLYQAEKLSKNIMRSVKRDVDGLICLGSADAETARELISPLPCVWVMGDGYNQRWCDRVAVDDRQLGYMSADYLLRHKHRRIAYLGKMTGFFGFRFEGFRTRLREADIEPDVFALTAEEFEKARNENTDILDMFMHQYLSNPEPATGMFVANDLITSMLYPVLLRHNIKIGKKLEIISADYVQHFRSGMHPQPAGIDIRYELLAQRTIDQLMKRLTESMSEAPWQLLLEPKIIPPRKMDDSALFV